MERIEEKALKYWDVIVKSVETKKGTHNQHIITTRDKKFVLREYNENYYAKKDDYLTELRFTRFLYENSFACSYPIENLSGNIYVEENKQLFALFNFVVGEHKIPPSSKEAFLYGQTLAKLHVLGRNFLKSDTKVNKEKLQDRSFTYLVLNAEKEMNMLLKKYLNQKKLFTHFSKIINQAKSELVNTNLEQGLIHADPHFENVLFQNGSKTSISFIDFDFIGYGYYLYDLATGLWSITSMKTENFIELLTSVIKGYKDVKEINIEKLKLFMELRNIETFVFQFKMAEQSGITLTEKFWNSWNTGIFDIFIPSTTQFFREN